MRSGRISASSSWYGVMSTAAVAWPARAPCAFETATTRIGHVRASASAARGGLNVTMTSCSYSPPAAPYGTRYTVDGAIDHHPSGSPSTCRS